MGTKWVSERGLKAGVLNMGAGPWGSMGGSAGHRRMAVPEMGQVCCPLCSEGWTETRALFLVLTHVNLLTISWLLQDLSYPVSDS